MMRVTVEVTGPGGRMETLHVLHVTNRGPAHPNEPASDVRVYTVEQAHPASAVVRSVYHARSDGALVLAALAARTAVER